MSNLITMKDFLDSKEEAVNLTDEEKEDANFERCMNDANELMEMVGEASNHDLTTLYFMFRDMGAILLDTGWTADELGKELHEDEAQGIKDKQ